MSNNDQFNQMLKLGLRANKKHNFIYLNNPKAACGSVKLNLWANIRNLPREKVIRTLHDVKKSPFSNQASRLDWAENACVFTIVRNPFTRVVSSYLDKIAKPGKRVRREFDTRYNIENERDVAFDEFVDLICADVPEALDHHWRPQYINVLEGFVQPNFIGTLENIGSDLPSVLSKVLGDGFKPVEASQRHKTNSSSSYLDTLSNPETVEKLCKLYARDFEIYGYAPDLAVPIQSSMNAGWSTGTHPELVKLAKFRKSKDPAEKLAQLTELAGSQGNAALQSWVGKNRRRLDAV